MGKFNIDAVFRSVDKMSGPMARMSAALDRFTARTHGRLDRLQAASSSVASGIKAAGGMLAGVGVVAGAAGASIIGAGADFEQAITNVGAVSLMTRGQIAELEKKALELGATTKFSATEVANAMEMMGKAGFSNAEIMSGVGGILAAAAADGGELAETASHISNVLKGMGLATAESSRVADVLTLASSRTNSSIGSLAESMQSFAPIAKQLNVPFESAVAQLALLQDAGLDASTAGTSLAATYSKLAAPMGTTAKEIAALGISVSDSMGNMKAPDQLFAEILGKTSKIKGNVGKMAAVTKLVGLESQKALLLVADAVGKGQLDSLNKELLGAAGSAQKMADIRMDTLKGDWETLGGSIDSVKIALFNVASGPLRSIIKETTSWVDANKDAIASGFVDFLENVRTKVNGLGGAIAILDNFTDGVEDAFLSVKPLLTSVGGMFGMFESSDGPRTQAYMFGRTVADIGIAMLGLSLATRVARGAVVAFTTAHMILKGIIIAGRNALIWYEIATKAGTASTLAMSAANVIAAGNFIRTRAAAFAASGGMAALAKTAGAAAAAYYALSLAQDQNDALKKENAGLGMGDLIWGSLTEGKGFFTQVDERMNAQAKAAARAEASRAPAPSVLSNPNDMMDERLQAEMARQIGLPPPPSGNPGSAPAGVVSPWAGQGPEELRQLFEGTIKIDINDPGKNADVKVEAPKKGLKIETAKSGKF